MVATPIPTPKSTTKTRGCNRVSIPAASAMPERSAPTLMVLATNKTTQASMRTQRGNFWRSALARPFPVTMPICAHMNWTQPMNGQVMKAVHSCAVPSCAPAIEYVAIPDGSSSAAPAINPGPNKEKNGGRNFSCEAIVYSASRTCRRARW